MQLIYQIIIAALLIQKELKAKAEMSWVNATDIEKDATDLFKQKSGQVSAQIIQISKSIC